MKGTRARLTFEVSGYLLTCIVRVSKIELALGMVIGVEDEDPSGALTTTIYMVSACCKADIVPIGTAPEGANNICVDCTRPHPTYGTGPEEMSLTQVHGAIERALISGGEDPLTATLQASTLADYFSLAVADFEDFFFLHQCVESYDVSSLWALAHRHSRTVTIL